MVGKPYSEFMEEASLPYVIEEETETMGGPSARTPHGSKAQA